MEEDDGFLMVDVGSSGTGVSVSASAIPARKKRRSLEKLVLGSVVARTYYNVRPSHRCRFAESPVCSMGNHYNADQVPRFLHECRTLPWFCYRNGFQALHTVNVRSDTGWGCMLRSGQMILARALLCNKWAKAHPQYVGCLINSANPLNMALSSIPLVCASLSEIAEVIKLFLDFPDDRCPFSIHHIIHTRAQLYPLANSIDWFSPSHISNILESLVTNHYPGIAMYSAKEGIIDIREITQLCSITNVFQRKLHQRGRSIVYKGWSPIFILVPLQLGSRTIISDYIPVIKHFLGLPQCVGIIGGRSRKSFYFIGFQEDKIIFLDPHAVRDVPYSCDYILFQDYVCPHLQKTSLSQINSSLAVGFYCHTQQELSALCSSLTPTPFLNPITINQ
ncbi:glycoside hydrolase family 43 protein [Pelomyxa schiedti]|nr:glycoside hydrolase family 43 protein [Pelomyxa schiedti]